MMMTVIDLTAQLGWLPLALDAVLLLSVAAIAAHVWASRRHAPRVPIELRPPAMVSAIVGRSPSVPAMAGQTPSDTSVPEAA